MGNAQVKYQVRAFVAAAAVVLVSVPATAQQYSDSYTFLKAVRERDGNKVTDLASVPGTVVLSAKDRSTGDTALHIVARNRDLSWLGFLLAKGAKADAQNNEGMTALAIAAQLGWTEGVEALLNRRASVDMANVRGETPLILAVQKRDVMTVRQLIAKGANPKKADRVAGYSALDYAKRDSRSAAIVKALEAPAPVQAPVAGPKL